ncbi:putative antirestriction protein [Parvularcula bermudensis HTCC2503]|uniref:Putative antirestriction protein n=1 Tax=Parvularcula bermudensis (strain ATCC BAA-594 / HTCC2503 / KCTC 12087) TaxID=314260 RepID=E0TH00_PARBH|nr:antirestriction protein ArdA [Parvularcula bermudensis]ADM09240.1 putative antirestriction protein [Parvularcula bermudensis HTCC2503]
MKHEESEIRIYVACLAAYNNGILHGRWVDATLGADHIRERIAEMLASSPIPDAEEYAIHDYEGFEGARIEEYSGVDHVAEIAAFIDEHGEIAGKLMEYFCDLEDAREAIEDRYCGSYISLADYAQEITEQTMEVPQSLQFYIDYEAMGRDLEINDVLAIETGFEVVHIFWRA